ncbi:MAG: LytTR family transcriptional regulator [Lachnospiraceae bacterium]|nr:LytTR family transcriptional regulator [Lachnospiraceae bacterium]
MVAMMLYDRNTGELVALRTVSRETFARISEENLELQCISVEKTILAEIEKCQPMDIACVKISGEKEIELLRYMRSSYEQLEILIIADKDISPMKYLTPDIRAASLLLAPYKEKDCQTVMKDFLQSFFQGREQLDEKKVLVITNREGKITIPYHQVYYIEIRERKVFIRLRDKEYSLYDSLEHMLEKLPEMFVRCHRSFVFNTQHLDAVKLSENTVYLTHGITVPLSRSYKPAIKEYIHGLCE